MKVLRSRVYEAEKEKKIKRDQVIEEIKLEPGIDLKESELIISPQGRVTDHRINLILHKLDEFLSGEIHEEMNQELRLKDQDLKLKELQ